MHAAEKDHHYVFLVAEFRIFSSWPFQSPFQPNYLQYNPNSPLATIGPADEKLSWPICNSCALYVNKNENLCTIQTC